MQAACNMYGDARRGNLAAHNAGNPFGGGGFAPDPTGGAYIAPTEPLAGGEGGGGPLSQESHPCSRPFGP